MLQACITESLPHQGVCINDVEENEVLPFLENLGDNCSV